MITWQISTAGTLLIALGSGVLAGQFLANWRRIIPPPHTLARGLFFGLSISLVFWLAVGWLIWG